MQRTMPLLSKINRFSDVGVPSDGSVCRHCDHARGVDHLGSYLHDDESAHDGEKCDVDAVHLHCDGIGLDSLLGGGGDDDARDGGGRDGGHGGYHGAGSTSLRDILSEVARKTAAREVDAL